jgi:hypothetical protein
VRRTCAVWSASLHKSSRSSKGDSEAKIFESDAATLEKVVEFCHSSA